MGKPKKLNKTIEEIITSSMAKQLQNGLIKVSLATPQFLNV